MAKRKASLPRVTVMAYRRQDLVAFVTAVEVLRLLVDDLRAVAEDLKRGTAKTRRVKAEADPFKRTAAEAKERAEFDAAAAASAPLVKGGAS